MTTPTPEFVRAVTQYRDAAATVRGRVMQFLTGRWAALEGWRDADADRFVTTILPVVIGGQRQMASLTDAYLSMLARQLLGSPGPAGVSTAQVTGAALRGVPPAAVYRRPFDTIWYSLSQGTPLAAAVALGGQRLEKIATTDLQLARTHAARERFRRDDRVVGYRRVVTGDNTCDLCEIASTQRYHSDDLMPIHPSCSCDVEPIYGGEDPGQIIDQDRLDEIKGRTSVAVEEHGELGPVLVNADHAFRGPDDI